MGLRPGESRRRKAPETLEIYAPLAHRLGIQTIKWELEDLSFAVLHPKLYAEIESLVRHRTPQREKYVQQVIRTSHRGPQGREDQGHVIGRPKHYYSIYQKMIVRGRDFDDIYDLIGIRVLVDSVRDCYAVLGAIHARWTPLPGRFKDYIATPKFNLYQSLHTTVIGPAAAGRDPDPHARDAPAGPSTASPRTGSTRTSRTGRRAGPGSPRDADMALARAHLGLAAGDRRPGRVPRLPALRNRRQGSLTSSPRKGEVMALPAGSTPVDFAYAVHTEVGHRTMGAKVNGRLVPLDSELNHGDWVEIFTSKAEGAGPSQDWLHFVKSARARNKIRQWFTKERREEAIERGKDLLTKAMRKQNLPLQRLMTQDAFAEVAEDFNTPTSPGSTPAWARATSRPSP